MAFNICLIHKKKTDKISIKKKQNYGMKSYNTNLAMGKAALQ